MTQQEQADNAARVDAERLPSYRLIQLEWNSRRGYYNDTVAGHRKNGAVT